MHDHVIILPAIVAPKLKTCATVAGGAGALTKCFPPTPATTTKTRRKKSHAQFWYLRKIPKSFLVIWVIMLTS